MHDEPSVKVEAEAENEWVNVADVNTAIPTKQ